MASAGSGGGGAVRRAASALTAEVASWGTLRDGRPISRYILRNASGMSLALTNYGATILSVKTPDKDGKIEEVTLNHDSLDDLVGNVAYFGTTAGRVANRIAKGKFELDGKAFQLATNNGENSLHGGVVGFNQAVWEPRVYVNESAAGVDFTYHAHDGEEGFPGNMEVHANYQLTAENTIRMEFTATTDAATPINLCNHTYWNLSGECKSDIRAHCLELSTPYYLPVDDTQIPTGEIVAVAGTDFDFLKSHPIGDKLTDIPGPEPGYDHCYARYPAGDGPSPDADDAPTMIARLEDPSSGRSMTVRTTQPGVQLYTGNFLGDGPAPFRQYHALCLETQHYPDAINQPSFPSIVLRPGETYRQVTEHEFKWT